jgi:hypothetical protein
LRSEVKRRERAWRRLGGPGNAPDQPCFGRLNDLLVAQPRRCEFQCRDRRAVRYGRCRSKAFMGSSSTTSPQQRTFQRLPSPV